MAFGEVGIFIPSMRPWRLPALIRNIAEATPEPHHAYFVIGDDESEAILKDAGATYWRDNGDTWGHRLNFLFEHTGEPFFFLGADDLLFHRGWCTAALLAMDKLPSAGVVSVNDLQGSRGTSALVSRFYIDSSSGCVDVPRVIIHPDYHHNYSETELYEVALRRGRFLYAGESHVEHLHHLSGKADHDDVYALGDSFWDQDETLFRQRQHLWGP